MASYIFLLFAFIGNVFCYYLAETVEYTKWGFLGFLTLIVLFIYWGKNYK